MIKALAVAAILSGTPTVNIGTAAHAEKGGISWYNQVKLGNRCSFGRCPNIPNGCAHKKAPKGTILHIEVAGRKFDCKVVDRGPYIRGRVVDLQFKLAQNVGLKGVWKNATITWEA
jgi:rare lipoprotein A